MNLIEKYHKLNIMSCEQIDCVKSIEQQMLLPSFLGVPISMTSLVSVHSGRFSLDI